MENIDINKYPMVRITWLDAKDTETGWLPVKEIFDAPLAVPRGWVRKIEYLKVEYATR